MSDERHQPKGLTMNINLDDDIRANRTKYKEETRNSTSKWVLIIAIRVFIGATSSTLSLRFMDNIIFRIQLSELNKELAADQAGMNAKLEEQKRINAVNAKQREIENQKRQAGLRQASETCSFWQREYQKNPTSINKVHKENSCDLINEFS